MGLPLRNRLPNLGSGRPRPLHLRVDRQATDPPPRLYPNKLVPVHRRRRHNFLLSKVRVIRLNSNTGSLLR